MKGLACSKRPENIINRKITFFYIKAMSKNFLRSKEKIFFRDPKKNKKNCNILKKIPEIFQKSKNFNGKSMIFH